MEWQQGLLLRLQDWRSARSRHHQSPFTRAWLVKNHWMADCCTDGCKIDIVYSLLDRSGRDIEEPRRIRPRTLRYSGKSLFARAMRQAKHILPNGTYTRSLTASSLSRGSSSPSAPAPDPSTFANKSQSIPQPTLHLSETRVLVHPTLLRHRRTPVSAGGLELAARAGRRGRCCLVAERLERQEQKVQGDRRRSQDGLARGWRR